MQGLQCPKCLVPLRGIERSGVVIERCPECGGIFLDRGELEHLMQAEQAYGRQDESSASGYGRDRDWDDDDDWRDDYGHPRKKKRRGFLEDLLDFG